MNSVKLNKIWSFVIAETHREKPDRKNLFKREFLFTLQVLLSRYELAKSEKNEKLMKFCADILETYEKYDINGHIIWRK